MAQSTETDLFADTLLLQPAPEVVPERPALPEKLIFTGNGSEYFRIWIVNLLFTIATLGIYSAWAKVRRMRYFYGNTRLDGSGFEYHGDPKAILKGRFIAAALLLAYEISSRYSDVVGLIMLAILAAVAPWLIWKSLQFKLHNTSYRGIRFGFQGSAKQAYHAFLLLPMLSVLSLSLLAPFTHQRIKKFQLDESRFGATGFRFHGTAGGFYKAYLITSLIYLGGVFFPLFIITMGNIATMDRKLAVGLMALLTFAVFPLAYLAYSLYVTMIQNLVWSNTTLGPHTFKSEMKAGRTVFILITNLIGIGLTLGLYAPFAKIRLMKYRIESVTLIPGENLDNFVADTHREVTAFGEGMADLLDYDFGL